MKWTCKQMNNANFDARSGEGDAILSIRICVWKRKWDDAEPKEENTFKKSAKKMEKKEAKSTMDVKQVVAWLL